MNASCIGLPFYIPLLVLPKKGTTKLTEASLLLKKREMHIMVMRKERIIKIWVLQVNTTERGELPMVPHPPSLVVMLFILFQVLKGRMYSSNIKLIHMDMIQGKGLTVTHFSEKKG